MQFPVNLNLDGRPCLVVGAGRIALRKTEQLLECAAAVTVLAPLVHDGFRTLPVSLIEREYRTGDAAGFRLVITATANLFTLSQFLRASVCCLHRASNNFREMIITKRS